MNNHKSTPADYALWLILGLGIVICIVVVLVNLYIGIDCLCFDKKGWPQ